MAPRSYLAAMLLLYLPSYQAFASTSGKIRTAQQPSSPAALHGAVGPCHPCPKVGLCNLLNTPSVTHVATLALVVISISPDRDV